MKVKYIIAPYQINPSLWTQRVASLSRSLMGQDISVISLHGCMLSGAYGDDTTQEQALQATHNIITMISKLLISELYAMLDDESLMSPDVEAQCNLWKQHNSAVTIVDKDGTPLP